jgi:hypothetical protein
MVSTGILMVTTTAMLTRSVVTTAQNSILWRQTSGLTRPPLIHAVLPQMVSTTIVTEVANVFKTTLTSWITAIMVQGLTSRSIHSMSSTSRLPLTKVETSLDNSKQLLLKMVTHFR